MDWGLIVAAVAAIPAAIAAVYSYRNFRDRVDNEPPDIHAWHGLLEDGSPFLGFKLMNRSTPDRWSLVSIEVPGLFRRRILAPVESDASWHKAVCFRYEMFGSVKMHPDCRQARLIFTCSRSSSAPLKRRTIKYVRPNP